MPKVSVTIKCVICNQFFIASKTTRTLVGGSRGKPIWNISNFQTHFRLHFKQSLDSKSRSLFKFLPDKSGCETAEKSDDADETEDLVFQRTSTKRKINVISDSEDATDIENVERNVDSGESHSGVSERQVTPEF